MEGEPHLGKIEECDLISKEYEIEDFIIGQLFDDETYTACWEFYATDDYTDDDIELDASEYMDTDEIGLYLDMCDENECDINKIYAAANVLNLKERKVK